MNSYKILTSFHLACSSKCTWKHNGVVWRSIFWISDASLTLAKFMSYLWICSRLFIVNLLFIRHKQSYYLSLTKPDKNLSVCWCALIVFCFRYCEAYESFEWSEDCDILTYCFNFLFLSLSVSISLNFFLRLCAFTEIIMGLITTRRLTKALVS